ncbi:dihydroorotate dehydrogenase (quinone), mitochondrial-like [Papaver somniferum]|uniref:dihydroorotate dehydrogenase (quinone), mitochondrial-like n=1 Tax=Papaver somniferum TaxID=3469 RepID=UPI000E6F7681|nr:dihydroorotate dehydrogenase (quinone), mitochondrial-like [Papaver somniferum]
MAARASRNYIKNLLYQNSRIGAFGGGGGGGALGAVRHSSSVPKVCPRILQFSKKGRIFTAAFLGIVISGGAYVSTADEATSSGWLSSATKLVNPFFAYLNAETAHCLAVAAAARGWVPREKRPDPSILGMEVWGRRISNPIDLSAGFDKNAEAVEGLLGKGFGFVEIGSSDEVLHGGKAGPDILDVNLGKNKTSEDAAADYVKGVHASSQYADYLVISISSPDTPGLRKLQGKEQLKDFVEKVQAARDGM